MKKILISALALGSVLFAGSALASEAQFDYSNNILTATVQTEPAAMVTSRITSSDGSLIAVGQELSDLQGNYTYTFTFDEEKRGDYTLRLSCAGEVFENTVYYTGREGCDFLMFAVKGVYGKISGDKIVITLPDSVSLNNVTPVFEVSEYATVTVDGEEQISGESKVNLNKKVTYTVTSGGGDIKEYTVSVKRESSGSSGGGGGGGGGGSASIPSVAPVLPVLPEEPALPEAENSGFKDVDSSHWAHADISGLASDGIISEAENFEPERSVTRAEFAKMAVLALGMYNPDAKCSFTDLADAPWSEAYVGSASQTGLVNGIGDSKFGFSAPVTRQDAAVILYRALKYDGMMPTFADRELISDYAFDGVGALEAAGILKGDENGSFRPLDSISRAEAAALINRVRSVQK